MSSREAFKKKGVDPQILQVIMLDELNERMAELNENVKVLRDLDKNWAPMKRPFPRYAQYQYRTVTAGTSARVYHLRNPQPDLLVGIIDQVGNSWFNNTYLDWITDYEPKRVEYVIADVHIPKDYQRGVPFRYEVEWIAYNDDVSDHVFEVLCDGYFIERKVYERIVG